MGPIKSFIDSLDSTAENERKAKDALEMSVKMIETRFKVFEDGLNMRIGSVDKMPAQYLLTMHKRISCDVKEGAASTSKAITEIVESFANGNAAKGIETVFSSALTMILGEYSASYNETQDYMVLTNIMGGLFRIDYLVVMQQFNSISIKDKLSSAFGCYLIISSINKEQMKEGSDNAYKIIIDRQFPSHSMKDKFLLLKLLKGEKLTEEEIDYMNSWKYGPDPPPTSITDKLEDPKTKELNRLKAAVSEIQEKEQNYHDQKELFDQKCRRIDQALQRLSESKIKYEAEIALIEESLKNEIGVNSKLAAQISKLEKELEEIKKRGE